MDVTGLTASVRARSRARYRRWLIKSAEQQLAARGGTLAVFDYPVHPTGRWGKAWNLPDHASLVALISPGENRYLATCHEIVELTPQLAQIPTGRPDDGEQPYWINGWIPGLDGAYLYSLVTHRNPAVYLEVGSGNSTKFVRRAIRDHGLRTKIISIDPHPRAEVDALCDEQVRVPLEQVDLAVFDELVSGDVCFIDCSHRALQNSDATVVFLEVLPRLGSGVEFGVHDIPLPEDYGPARQWSWYSEQYVFGAYLLGRADSDAIQFPTRYISSRPHLSGALAPLWSAIPEVGAVHQSGSGFWIRTP